MRRRNRLADYAATERALVNELIAYMDADAPMFLQYRQALGEAAEPLLQAATSPAKSIGY